MCTVLVLQVIIFKIVTHVPIFHGMLDVLQPLIVIELNKLWRPFGHSLNDIFLCIVDRIV